MITRTVSNNTFKHVAATVEDLVSKVATRKRVTWAPEGITKAMTFEIEPWRRIRPTPSTSVRGVNGRHRVAPFTLPDAPMMKPLADYTSPWWPILPSAPVSCDLVLIDDDDDKKPGAAPAPLARTQPVSLAVVYAIAEELRKIEDMKKFINESERVELEEDLDDEFGPWADDMKEDVDTDGVREYVDRPVDDLMARLNALSAGHGEPVVQTTPPNFDHLEARFNARCRRGHMADACT
jgi:hypothetical protein